MSRTACRTWSAERRRSQIPGPIHHRPRVLCRALDHIEEVSQLSAPAAMAGRPTGALALFVTPLEVCIACNRNSLHLLALRLHAVYVRLEGIIELSR
jgi:hypothetical protein